MKRFSTLIAIAFLSVAGAADSEAQESRLYRKGYGSNVELGIIAKGYPYGSLSTTHGYNFGNGWFIGGGAAFQSGLYPRIYSYPIPAEPAAGNDEIINIERPNREQFEGGFLLRGYLDARYAFRNNRFTPFLEVRTGATYDLALEAFGAFIMPSAGISYGRMSFSAGLDMHLGQESSGCLIRPDFKFMPYFGIAVNF